MPPEQEIPFRFVENGAEIKASCSVSSTDQPDVYVVAVMSTGGGRTEQNSERRKAREMAKARLADLGALVIAYQIGEGEKFDLSEEPSMAGWEFPSGISTKALRLWARLPSSAGVSNAEGLRALLVGASGAAAPTGLGLEDSVPDAADPIASDVMQMLRAYRNVVVEGVAGTGKSHLIAALRKAFTDHRVELMVFHPATAYEDFVEGLRPAAQGGFDVRDGAFLQLCRRAAQAAVDGSSGEWVLVIDEINRANTAKVLGDLLYALEPSKRAAPAWAAHVLDATLQDPVLGEGDVKWLQLQLERPVLRRQRPGRPAPAAPVYRQRLVVPDNLLILGTMNTTDRSVGVIDLALRRRFVFHRMSPMDGELLKGRLPTAGLDGDIDEWGALNEKLESISPDALLGHSYFFDFHRARGVADAPGSLNVWRDFLLPQLAEILLAFNATDQLSRLLDGGTTGGYTLRLVGSGVDAYPVVEARG